MSLVRPANVMGPMFQPRMGMVPDNHFVPVNKSMPEKEIPTEPVNPQIIESPTPGSHNPIESEPIQSDESNKNKYEALFKALDSVDSRANPQVCFFRYLTIPGEIVRNWYILYF